MSIATKRAYDAPSAADGYRVLVDGLWPRGIKKEKLKLSEWMRPIAPSTELRQWYGHQPERWDEFRKRYRKELQAPDKKVLVEKLIERARQEKVTLIFAAHEAEHCNAGALAEIIRQSL